MSRCGVWSSACTVSVCAVTGRHMLEIHTFSSHHLDQVVRALLENGGDLEKQQNQGFTALMLAAQNGHGQVRSTQHDRLDRYK